MSDHPTQPASQPASRPVRPGVRQLEEAMAKLRPLHQAMGKPHPGDWVTVHSEPGQTFRQYVACDPTLPQGERNVLHIQPLGQLSATQQKVVELTSRFMAVYFNLPAKVQEPLPESLVPPSARRVHPSWGDRQVLSTYVLDKILKPRLPKDAAAYLAFTASDLWPGQGWNFVFGQASLTERVGVWSLYRYGDPDAGADQFRLCLLRTMKTAVHETAHMFSMYHCIAHECGMNGSNSLAESDRRPLALCPECMAKVCWATHADPQERYRKLAEFCGAQGLDEQGRFYVKSAAALSGGK